MYDHTLMCQHLAHIFQLQRIEHFPRIIRSNDPKKLFTLDEIQKREALARKKRERRQKKSAQEKSVNLIEIKNNISEMIMEQVVKKKDNMSESLDCYNIMNKNNIVNKCDNIEYSNYSTFNSSSLLLSIDKMKNNEINNTNNFLTCTQENILLKDTNI